MYFKEENMAYEFKKIAEVEALDKVPDGANALIEVNGEIKRVPGNGLGGAGGIATAIIKSSDYDNAVAGISTFAASDAPPVTYSCINMTYEEAREILKAGKPLTSMIMLTNHGAAMVVSIDACMVDADFIAMAKEKIQLDLYWTSDGISTTGPGSK